MSASGYAGKLSTKGKACPICLEDFTPAHAALGAECGHIFHPSCLNEWCESAYRSGGREPNCPLCRGDVTDTAMTADAFEDCRLRSIRDGSKIPNLPNSTKLRYVKNCLRAHGRGERIPFTLSELLAEKREIGKETSETEKEI